MSVFHAYAEAAACFRVRSGQDGGSTEYRRQALGINWEGQLLYLPRRLSDYRKRRRKTGENSDVGSYSMQMMRITMQ